MSSQDCQFVRMEETIIAKAEGEEKSLIELWNELRYYWDNHMRFPSLGKSFRKHVLGSSKLSTQYTLA